jgi:hypothetical protein
MAADSDESKAFFAIQCRKRLAALLQEAAIEEPAMRETVAPNHEAAPTQSLAFAPFASAGAYEQLAVETIVHPVESMPFSSFSTALIPPLAPRGNLIQAEQ